MIGDHQYLKENYKKIPTLALSTQKSDRNKLMEFLRLYSDVASRNDQESRIVVRDVREQIVNSSLLKNILKAANTSKTKEKYKQRALLYNANEILKRFPQLVLVNDEYIGALKKIPVDYNNYYEFKDLILTLEKNALVNNQSELDFIMKHLLVNKDSFSRIVDQNPNLIRIIADNINPNHVSDKTQQLIIVRFGEELTRLLSDSDDTVRKYIAGDSVKKQNIRDALTGLITIAGYDTLFGIKNIQGKQVNVFYDLVRSKRYDLVKHAIERITDPDQRLKATIALDNLISFSIKVNSQEKIVEVNTDIWQNDQITKIIDHLMSKGAELGKSFRRLEKDYDNAFNNNDITIAKKIKIIIDRVHNNVIKEYGESILDIFARDKPTKSEFKQVFSRIADPLNYPCQGTTLFNYIVSQNHDNALNAFFELPEVADKEKTLMELSGKHNFMIETLSYPVQNFAVLVQRYPDEVTKEYHDKNSLAHLAAGNDKAVDHLVFLLKNNNRFFNISNNRGENIMHVIARTGNLISLNRLSKEFDKTILLDSLLATDENGRTALDLAVMNNHHDMVNALQSLGINKPGVNEDNISYRSDAKHYDKGNKPHHQTNDIAVQSDVISSRQKNNNIVQNNDSTGYNTQTGFNMSDLYQGIFLVSFAILLAVTLFTAFGVFGIKTAPIVPILSAVGSMLSLGVGIGIGFNKERIDSVSNLDSEVSELLEREDEIMAKKVRLKREKVPTETEIQQKWETVLKGEEERIKYKQSDIPFVNSA